jgi:hypothetical protein
VYSEAAAPADARAGSTDLDGLRIALPQRSTMISAQPTASPAALTRPTTKADAPTDANSGPVIDWAP